MEQLNEEFNGTFYFTNPTDKERKYLWNNREYAFPANSTVPLIVMGEPLENIQEIRKRFAYRMAEERLYEGEKMYGQDGKTIIYDYKKAKEMGNGLPPTFSPEILESWIEECLKPLPIAKAVIKEGKKDQTKYKATKAIGQNDNPSYVFAEENKNPPVLGEMPNK